MSPRLALAGGALAATGLLAAVAPLAHAGPKCSGAAATAVHAVEEVAEVVPAAGPVVGGLLHGPVEDAACQLP